MKDTTTITVFDNLEEGDRTFWIDQKMICVPDTDAKLEIDWESKTVSIVRKVQATLNVKFAIKI